MLTPGRPHSASSHALNVYTAQRYREDPYHASISIARAMVMEMSSVQPAAAGSETGATYASSFEVDAAIDGTHEGNVEDEAPNDG